MVLPQGGEVMFSMDRRWRGTGWLVVLMFCLVAAAGGWGQTQPAQPKPDQKPEQKQDIPDAPSSVRPPPTFPTVPPTSEGDTPPPSSSGTTSGTAPATAPASPVPPAALPGAPPTSTDTTFPGDAPTGQSSDTGFKIVVPVNDVLIPVRVTDGSGRLVDGLLNKDFVVYEDGKKQTLDFFSSSAFALSAAVILDLGMPDEAVQKVNRTFSALQGAFSPYDEVAIYTYSSTVGRMADFSAAGKKLAAVLDGLKNVTGRVNGPPIVDGPIGPGGPMINGIPLDPNQPHVRTPPQESHVLNDAILAAALDLSKRDRTRRRIIFVISDGREIHSNSSYRDVLKVLLTNGIAVYGVGVGGASIPGYGTMQKLHLPRMGYGDILPKYANATAGEFFPEMSRNAIETAYARAIGEARNQYTLGYAARVTPSEAYRQIEVTVDRPDVKVYAKDGYYSAPQAR
jgi:VWFA-related protein